MSSYPPPPPQGFGPPPAGAYGPMRTTNGKAIAALVCGIAAFVVCPLLSVAAVILGPQAKREIAAAPDRFDGDGLAKAGQILGWVGIGLTVVAVVFFILFAVVLAATGTSTSEGTLAALVG